MASVPSAKSSLPILELQELAINITALDLKPGVINVDLLKMSGVIPAEWELAQTPVQSEQVVQLSFTNGLNILSQARRLMLLEQTTDKDPSTIQGPAIAQAYLSKFPHAHYQGISIAPKILIGFPDHPQAPQQFITQKLLAPGPWQTLGQEPLRAALTLNYVLKRCPFSLNIAEVQFNQGAQGEISGLLFTGNFTYSLPNPSPTDPLDYFTQRLKLWQTDVQQFRELLYRKFMGGGAAPQTSVKPTPPPSAPTSNPEPDTIPRSLIDSIFPDLF
jgi:hypothetical protein